METIIHVLFNFFHHETINALTFLHILSRHFKHSSLEKMVPSLLLFEILEIKVSHSILSDQLKLAVVVFVKSFLLF